MEVSTPSQSPLSCSAGILYISLDHLPTARCCCCNWLGPPWSCPARPQLCLDPKIKSRQNTREEHFVDAPWASAKLFWCCGKQKTMPVAQWLLGQRLQTNLVPVPPQAWAPRRPEEQKGSKTWGWPCCLGLYPPMHLKETRTGERKQARGDQHDLSRQGRSFYSVSGNPLSICSWPQGNRRSTSWFLLSLGWVQCGVKVWKARDLPMPGTCSGTFFKKMKCIEPGQRIHLVRSTALGSGDSEKRKALCPPGARWKDELCRSRGLKETARMRGPFAATLLEADRSPTCSALLQGSWLTNLRLWIIFTYSQQSLNIAAFQLIFVENKRTGNFPVLTLLSLPFLLLRKHTPLKWLNKICTKEAYVLFFM